MTDPTATHFEREDLPEIDLLSRYGRCHRCLSPRCAIIERRDVDDAVVSIGLGCSNPQCVSDDDACELAQRQLATFDGDALDLTFEKPPGTPES